VLAKPAIFTVLTINLDTKAKTVKLLFLPLVEDKKEPRLLKIFAIYGGLFQAEL
jgi:hypothetical protein